MIGQTAMRTRLDGALDFIDQAFALFDSADRLVHYNSAYLRMLGLEGAAAPLVGLHFEEILDCWINRLDFGSEALRVRFRAERLSQRSAAAIDFDVRTTAGRWLRVSERRTPEGGLVSLIGDATADVHRSESLASANAVAQAANLAKSEFIGTLSHELKTALNTILGFAQLLQRDLKEPLSERHRKRVAQILSSGESLLQLAQELRELSHIEDGRLILSLEPVGVPNLMESVRAALALEAARAGISLEIFAPTAGSNLMVLADPLRLKQVLLNFGLNAIHEGQRGGRIRLISFLRPPQWVRVMVSDTSAATAGSPVGSSLQPLQSPPEDTALREDSPPRLVIAKRLAELMGGQVGFRRILNHAWQSWVDLPAGTSTPS